jgi:ubiquinone/menaquinone biosynthesis C-methylase UbiE
MEMVSDFTETKNGFFLELGCGPGYVVEFLSKRNDNFINGLDISPKMIEIATARTPSARLILGDGERIGYQDETFDTIACSHTLHHYPSLQKVMSEINRVLKVEGYLVIQEPNEFFIFDQHLWLYRPFNLLIRIAKLFGIQEYEDMIHLEPGHTSHHRRLTSSELLDILAQNNFKVIWHRELYLASWVLRNLKLTPLVNLSIWLDRILCRFIKGGVFITIVGQKR